MKFHNTSKRRRLFFFWTSFLRRMLQTFIHNYKWELFSRMSLFVITNFPLPLKPFSNASDISWQKKLLMSIEFIQNFTAKYLFDSLTSRVHFADESHECSQCLLNANAFAWKKLEESLFGMKKIKRLVTLQSCLVTFKSIPVNNFKQSDIIIWIFPSSCWNICPLFDMAAVIVWASRASWALIILRI